MRKCHSQSEMISNIARYADTFDTDVKLELRFLFIQLLRQKHSCTIRVTM